MIIYDDLAVKMVIFQFAKEPEGTIRSYSPNRFTCMGFLLLSKGCIPGPHDFASVSGLASHSRCLGPHEFTPVFHLSFHLSATLGALCCMSLQFTLVSHTCLALWVPWAA